MCKPILGQDRQIIDQNNKPNPSVLYLLNTPGFNVQLRKGGFSYDVYRISNIEQRSLKSDLTSPFVDQYSTVQNQSHILHSPTSIIDFHRIDIDLVGSNPYPKIETSEPSSDYLNYYTIGTPDEGVTFVRSYQTVTYKNIYPGIDLVFIADKEGSFEYNFIIQPGADISSIQLKVQGPEKIKRFRDGISYETHIGEIDESAPICFYRINDKKVPVKGRFKKVGDHLYGFSIDQEIPEGAVLVIDPIPTRRWGTYYGGTGGASLLDAKPLSVDGDGNSIVAGTTGSTDNIATAGAYQIVLRGNYDAFIVKFNPDGQRLWGTYYGGSSSDLAYSSTIDKQNNIIIVGSTGSSDYMASPGAYQAVKHGDEDGFVAKFTPAGQRLWGTYYGGSNLEEYPYCTATKNGYSYLTGNTVSPNNIATPGSFVPTYPGINQGFLAAFDPDGQRLWGTYFAGQGGDITYGCTADTGTNVYIFGVGTSPNIGTPGAFQETPIPSFGTSSYLSKFNLTGQYLWGTFYGGTYLGSYAARILGAAVDDSGYVYISGWTDFQDSLLAILAPPGAWQTEFGGGYSDGFLAKFTGNGQQRIWGTLYGGIDQDAAYSCAVDASDNIFLCGNTMSQNNSDNSSFCKRSMDYNHIATPGSFQQENLANNWTMFLVKFSDCYSPDTALQIFGPVEVCESTNGINYSIDPIYGAADYHWCVSPNLTITTGQNTTSVTVDVGPVPGIDTISVYGINSCDNGFPKVMTIMVYSRPVPVINGNDTSCTGVPKVYTTIGGQLNYQWSVSAGGTIVLGGTSVDSSCTVLWNTSGAQWVSVNYTNNKGCEALTPSQYNVWVSGGVPVSVSVNSTATNVCAGTPVTFTATPVNGGTAPSYQWKVNGINAGLDNPVFTYTPVNGDVIFCVLTSSDSCVSNNPASSNPITMTVSQILPVSITIAPSANNICAGTLVTFTASSVNPGSNPIYQWKVNGVNAGTNLPVYTYTPANGDSIRCILTSNDSCSTNNPCSSNKVIMTVNPNLPVSVTISPSANPVCDGNSVTFTALPVNEGLSPVYQWQVNGVNTGTNSPGFTYTPANGDAIICILTSSLICTSDNPATSNTVVMTVNTNMPVSVSVSANANPVCAGTQVQFTALPVNEGLLPVYQWKVNGINTGPNSPVFTYTPANNDAILCVLTSSLGCTTGNPATSNTVVMIVNPNLPVTITISPTANPVCSGTSVTFNSSVTNGGILPIYQWRVNGINVGVNSPTFNYIPVSGDQVSCVLTSDATCATGNPATSNTVIMTVNPNLPVSVSISASANPVCQGTPVTFTAIPVNGGITPSYQWQVNGINVGTNSPVYTYNPGSGDLVSCILTSSITCPRGNPAMSNSITMGVAALPVVTLTLCNDPVTTTNAVPFKLKGGVPLGGTYSGPGVNSATGIFYPALAGTGIKTITYSYTNAALCSANATLTITVIAPVPFLCGNNLTDVRDNKSYPTVQLGDQCWIAANLNYGTQIAGSIDQRDNCIVEKYCYNDLTADCGRQTFYQWEELMQFDATAGIQGLCPPAWHIPTEADWNTLFALYINNAFAGSPLKYSGYSGFNALLTGARLFNKSWSYDGFATFFWSSTPWGPTKAWAHAMNDVDPSVALYPASRANAFSVRCIKD